MRDWEEVNQMNIRERKRSLEDAAFEQACEWKIDLSSWQEKMPEVIEKAQNRRHELRTSAYKTINHINSGLYLPTEFLPHLELLMPCIRKSILQPDSTEEHDAACQALNSLALNLGPEFTEHANMIVQDILPTLYSITDDHKMRFFTVAFLTVFSGTENAVSEPILEKFLIMAGNKASRVAKFSGPTVVQLVKAIQLILCSPEILVDTEEILNSIEQAIERGYQSSKPEVIVSLIDLALVAYQALSEEAEDTENNTKVERFKQKYLGKFQAPRQNFTKKGDASTVEEACLHGIRVLNGEEPSFHVTIAKQPIEIYGVKGRVILDSIRRVAGHFFDKQMEANKHIHDMLNYELKSKGRMRRILKATKMERDAERAIMTKERQLQIRKERAKKANVVGL